jgi:hypothetical protein
MAIVENPIIGKASGSVGNIVFSTWKEKNVIRTKPFTCRNPKTPDQVSNRQRCKKLMILLRQVLNNINVAYAGSVPGMSSHNHEMSINLKNCFIGRTQDIDPAMFVLCDNDGSFVNNVILTSTTANTIIGTFNSNAQNDDESEDLIKAYGFDVDGNKIWQFDQSAIRRTGTITLTHSDMSGLNIAVYFECLDRVNLLMDKPKHVIKYVGAVKVDSMLQPIHLFLSRR